ARTRLAQLEAEHNKALDQVAAGLFGTADRTAAMERGASNAKALRQQAGRDRLGRVSGASGPKVPLRASLADERRAQAEQAVQDAIARNPEHPTMRQWAGRTSEIDQLRAALNPELGG